MAGLEGKGKENGDLAEKVPEVAAVAEMKVETGVTHRRSQETIDRAEALKTEGNQMLSGKRQRKPDSASAGAGAGASQVVGVASRLH